MRASFQWGVMALGGGRHLRFSWFLMKSKPWWFTTSGKDIKNHLQRDWLSQPTWRQFRQHWGLPKPCYGAKIIIHHHDFTQGINNLWSWSTLNQCFGRTMQDPQFLHLLKRWRFQSFLFFLSTPKLGEKPNLKPNLMSIFVYSDGVEEKQTNPDDSAWAFWIKHLSKHEKWKEIGALTILGSSNGRLWSCITQGWNSSQLGVSWGSWFWT